MTDIIQTLCEMRSGQVISDLNEKFNKVLVGVLETAGKGSLTIKLNLRPSKMGMGGVVLEVQADHECKVTVPELEIGSAVFYVGKDGNLSRDDPSQRAMFEAAEAEEPKKEAAK